MYVVSCSLGDWGMLFMGYHSVGPTISHTCLFCLTVGPTRPTNQQGCLVRAFLTATYIPCVGEVPNSPGPHDITLTESIRLCVVIERAGGELFVAIDRDGW